MASMSKNYLVTDYYCELEHKARLFADVFDYDSAIGEGIFQFYNSPCFRSFSFTVDPATFQGDVSSYLFKQFMERLDNYDK